MPSHAQYVYHHYNVCFQMKSFYPWLHMTNSQAWWQMSEEKTVMTITNLSISEWAEECDCSVYKWNTLQWKPIQ